MKKWLDISVDQIKLNTKIQQSKFGEQICKLINLTFRKLDPRQLKCLLISIYNTLLKLRIGRYLLSEHIYSLKVAISILISNLKAKTLQNKYCLAIFQHLRFLTIYTIAFKSGIRSLFSSEQISLMISRLKARTLQNKYGRLICRHIILTLRKLNPFRLEYLLILDDRLRNFAFKSRFGTIVLSEHIYLTRHILTKLENSTKNRNILFRIAKFYKLQKEYEKAFDLFLMLVLSEEDETKLNVYIIKALQTEREVEEKKLLKLYESGELSLPEKTIHFLTCEYSQHSNDIVPNWEAIINLLEKDFDYALANFFMLAALGYQQIKYIDKIRDLLISKKYESHELYFERSVTMIATSYYRSGERSKLKQLDKTFSFDSLNWKLYMAFGHGKILKAMRYRGEAIKNTFLRFYPIHTKLKNQYVLVPEKDICGEAFNALFYTAVYKNRGKFSVTCDNRLFTILQRTFPNIHFIAKTPRYMQKSLPEKFNKLNGYLRDFMDHNSFYQTRGANFFNIDYEALYEHEDTKKRRKDGWLKTDDNLRKHWIKKFGKSKKLIGVSANSTVRSRIRDIHMISMDRWEEIFNLPNCKFINLNASVSEEDINTYVKKYNIEFITPDIDLFNDFDNLLAIMSILDFAVVPANNMMDFASSLGLNTIVFSPSNIMKTWVIKDDKYIFSEKVKFIFPRTKKNKIDRMVKDGAKYIKDTISLNCS